jgi:hypothetical protein|nr:MAG TPA: P63C domain protein [Caudoviricetes sp.]
MDRLLKSIYGSDKTPLKLGDLEIPCYVLEDGTRVFSGRGVQKAIGYDSKSGQWMKSFCNIKGLSPYFYAGDQSIAERLSNPIKFKRVDAGGSQSDTNGYEVTLLVDICSIIIDANRAGDFDDTKIVRNADIIIRSVAKVGIIALVDEVTGYQQDKNRAKDELQKFLAQFISDEASRWVKTFNDSFFEMIYRMHGWSWTLTHRRPGVVGKWINDIVYERLAPVILTELQKVNPKTDKGTRKDRHHQHLTEDVGRPKLKEHLAAVEALGRASGYNWAKFMQMLNAAFPKQYQQLDLLFPDDVRVENGE